ncbi:MAG TPA: methyltransferase domain-containing protein [Burkholderiales bacterium]|nr:methyltransferase domain-containing protein [Burkholderiales bacterium]
MDAFRVDARQARRAFERAARRGEDAAALQNEVERRMLERLEYVRLAPRRVLDAGCGTGRGVALLRGRYPKADVLGVDFAESAVGAASRSGSFAERVRSFVRGARVAYVCADFARLPLPGGSIDLLWSNLALPWAEDPLAALREFQRVLAVGGLMMFSSYGPDTLKELRSAFTAASPARRVHSFADMHDVGDMLVACGFSAPVMDVETITLTYGRADDLARDLQTSGQTCAARDRQRALTARGAWRRMLAAYEEMRRGGRLPATFEIVYGHAWKGEPRTAPDGRQIVKWTGKITP